MMKRVLGTAFLVTCLSACAISPAAGITVKDDAKVDLLPGQSARMDDGSTLHYARMVNESRCPPDVQCIWAGDAEIALQWHTGNVAPQAIHLHTNTSVGPNHVRLGTRNITLLALTREDHRATLQVQRSP